MPFLNGLFNRVPSFLTSGALYTDSILQHALSGGTVLTTAEYQAIQEQNWV